MAAAAVLAGCAKTEVTKVADGRAIAFDNFVSNSVKSIDQTSDLTNFYVSGGYSDGTFHAVFDNQEVRLNGSDWEYTPVRYWTSNQTYYFAAYSNNNASHANVSFGETTHHLTITGFTVADSEADDLIYAQGNASGYSWDGIRAMDPVEFTFYHVLSKVMFSFTKSADLNGMEMNITGITVNPYTSGTFMGTDISGSQYPFFAWTAPGDQSDVIFGNITNLPDAGSEPTQTEARVFIPQSVSGYNVTFAVEHRPLNADGSIDTDGEMVTKNFSVSIAGTTGNQWSPGHVYVYNAEIKAANLKLEPIEFTVTDVSDWETEETITDIVDDTIGTDQ